MKLPLPEKCPLVTLYRQNCGVSRIGGPGFQWLCNMFYPMHNASDNFLNCSARALLLLGLGVEQNRKQETGSFQKLLELVISGKCMHSRYPHKTTEIKNSCKNAHSRSTPNKDFCDVDSACPTWDPVPANSPEGMLPLAISRASDHLLLKCVRLSQCTN